MGVAMHASTIRNNLIGKKCVAEHAVRFAVDNSDFFFLHCELIVRAHEFKDQ